MTDLELVLLWAGQEFVAAGRAQSAQDRDMHRNNAVFYSDLCRELEGPLRPKAALGLPEHIGLVLSRAFPPARQSP